MLKIPPKDVKTWIGWIAFSISILTACFWAFWGIIENFHEGWYHEALGQNLVMMFAQYLAPVIITITLSLVGIFRNKLGALFFLGTGIFLAFFVNNPIASVPLILIGTLFWFGDFSPKKWKYRLMLILPGLTLIIAGIEPIVRVSSRVNDRNFQAREIRQNGVALVWAPQGPGWPEDGMSWHEADSICTYLNEDGLSLSDHPQNIWRLPTVEEAVKSMQRHGKNAKGKLDTKGNPEYETRPDKETPLWNPNRQVIYWWTSTEIDSAKAYIIVYDGKIWERRKNFGPKYLGFREVKDID